MASQVKDEITMGSDDGDIVITPERITIENVETKLCGDISELHINQYHGNREGEDVLAKAMAGAFTSLASTPIFRNVLEIVAEQGAEKAYEKTFADVQALLQRNQKLEDQVADLNEEVNRLNGELKVSKKDKEDRIKELIKLHKEEISKINKEKRKLQDEIVSKNGLINQLKREVNIERTHKEKLMREKGTVQKKAPNTKSKKS